MSDLDLAYMSASGLAKLVKERKISPVEIVKNCLDRIEEVDPRLNAFCFTYPELALEAARVAERRVTAGESLGPLHGVPFAAKDLTQTQGKTTTLGSYVYRNWVPDRDVVYVERLRRAGAIMIGKTTTPEFAGAIITESPMWGVTRNPWNTAHTPGGSSGGSAAAVAAGCVPLAEGSDAGGSVRIPAAFCGVVGMKPSFGRIPFDTLPTQFHTLWHFGPLCRTVEDAARFLNAAQGPDDRDIFSLPPLAPVPLPLSTDLRGLRLALSTDFGYYAVDPEVAEQTEACAEALRARGASVESVELGWRQNLNEAFYDLFRSELAALYGHHLAKWRDRMDPFIVQLIEEADSLHARRMEHIQKIRIDLWDSLRVLFNDHDALLCPTTSVPAPEVGQSELDYYERVDDGRCHALEMTFQFNLVPQCPAISVPSGFTASGLPTGLQIVGRRYDDETVLRIAAALEESRPWNDKRPAVETATAASAPAH